MAINFPSYFNPFSESHHGVANLKSDKLSSWKKSAACGSFIVLSIITLGIGIIPLAMPIFRLLTDSTQDLKKTSDKVNTTFRARIGQPMKAYVDENVSEELKAQFRNRQNIGLVKPSHPNHAERLTLMMPESKHYTAICALCARDDTVLILDCSAYDTIDHEYVNNNFDSEKQLEKMGDRVILWKSGADITEQVNKHLGN